ncbi:MAG: uroporphyrinogen-III synthase [Bacteroidetes bacterium]|nr:uroporphyrinogen-III synthase [Bacteroidota bacterium]
MRSPKKLETLQNRIQILSTRPIDPTQIKTANDLGIDIDCISFIETTAIESKDILSKIKEVLSNKATVVFTSMNAIDAVVSQLSNSKPDWAVYCMGVTSNQLIKQNFREDAVVGTATNSAELAELIIAEKRSNQIYFFCGDQRRDELPSILKNNGILVKEIEVYHTKEIKHTISKDYDGILFFSPSAVISFFNSNSLPEQSVAFAIGKTTASTLISRTNNKVVVAELPGKDKLVKKMMDHFQNH